MKKRIIITVTLSIISLILLGILTIIDAPNKSQEAFLTNSDNYLFNKGYEKEFKTSQSIKGCINYVNYIKNLNKDKEITNVAILGFKDKKTLNNFNANYIKELDSNINKTKTVNKAAIFTNKALDNKTKIYTSIYQKEKECSTMLIKRNYDAKCFIVITGVGKAEKEDFKTLTNHLVKESRSFVSNFNKENKRKKDYLSKAERSLFTKAQRTLVNSGFEVFINPAKVGKNFDIMVSANMANKKQNELLSIVINFNNDKLTNLKSYNEREKAIKEEIKNNKSKEKKYENSIKNYKGYIYETMASNGTLVSEVYKSDNNNVLISFDYRKYSKKADMAKIKKQINDILYQLLV